MKNKGPTIESMINHNTMLAVGVSGETLIKGTHSKSINKINKTVIWGYKRKDI